MERRPLLSLLDTHALLWAIDQPQLLSPAARRAVENGEVVVSIISLWELLTKKDRPAAPLRDPLRWWRTYVLGRGTRILDIQAGHVERLDTLPPHHKDPFDRILLCQCLAEDLRLVTNDELLRTAYGGLVHCLW